MSTEFSGKKYYTADKLCNSVQFTSWSEVLYSIFFGIIIFFSIIIRTVEWQKKKIPFVIPFILVWTLYTIYSYACYNIWSDSKSLALPNSTKSSFSFIFVTFTHFLFTNVSNINKKCCTILHLWNRWGIFSLCALQKVPLSTFVRFVARICGLNLPVFSKFCRMLYTS